MPRCPGFHYSRAQLIKIVLIKSPQIEFWAAIERLSGAGSFVRQQ